MAITIATGITLPIFPGQCKRFSHYRPLIYLPKTEWFAYALCCGQILLVPTLGLAIEVEVQFNGDEVIE